MCLYLYIEPVFALLLMFGVLFFCHSPSVLNE
jgi:drug/metabolite transporter (DMT)-like permease